jgi:hypothetical protein
MGVFEDFARHSRGAVTPKSSENAQAAEGILTADGNELTQDGHIIS